MARPVRTRWKVDRRRYFLKGAHREWEDGVAEKVRAEREDGTAWVRVLEASHWWPQHEGKEEPAVASTGPKGTGRGHGAAAWAQLRGPPGRDAGGKVGLDAAGVKGGFLIVQVDLVGDTNGNDWNVTSKLKVY